MIGRHHEPLTDRQMICEGVCNPHRLDVQRLVPPMASRQVDHDDKRMTTILPVNDNVAQALRTLKHTTHRPTLGEWVCTVCGRKRD